MEPNEATIYHVTPITPKARFEAMAGRAMMVSHYRPDQLSHVLRIAGKKAFDCGAFSYFTEMLRILARAKAEKPRKGDPERLAWLMEPRNWQPYYAWLEPMIAGEDRWAIIPDVIAEGSQAQDALLRDWPFGEQGVPVWHTGEPIDRLLRLCDAWPRVAIGSTDEHWQVGGDLWLERMDEAWAAILARHSHPLIHMLRGTAVSHLYPFDSADSSSLGQNGHLYVAPLFEHIEPHRGPIAYADKLENPNAAWRVRRPLPTDRGNPEGTRGTSLPRSADEQAARQFGLW